MCSWVWVIARTLSVNTSSWCGVWALGVLRGSWMHVCVLHMLLSLFAWHEERRAAVTSQRPGTRCTRVCLTPCALCDHLCPPLCVCTLFCVVSCCVMCCRCSST